MLEKAVSALAGFWAIAMSIIMVALNLDWGIFCLEEKFAQWKPVGV